MPSCSGSLTGWVKGVFSLLALVLGLQTHFAFAADDEAVLSIGGEVDRPAHLSLADIAKLPHESVRVTGHNGETAVYEGVRVLELLKTTGLTFGQSLRGKRLATYLLVGAADGYQVVFALPELDPAFTDRAIVVAYLKDGKPLPAEEGPIRVIVPDEKRGARSIRQVKSMAVLRASQRD